MRRNIFPTSASSASEWAKRHNEPEELAVRRWIKFAALDCLARDPVLSQTTILRGSLAMSFYDPTCRLGADIDIHSTLLNASSTDADVNTVIQSFDRAVHSWIQVHFPDLRRWLARIKADVKIELLRLEYDMQCNIFRLPPPSNRKLKVLSIEAIMAEKLQAILQEACLIRHGQAARSRSKDIFDLHRLLTQSGNTIKLRSIHDHYQKCCYSYPYAGDLALNCQSFDDFVRALAARQYVGKTHGRAIEVPFDVAWTSVASLVAQLSKINEDPVSQCQLPSQSLRNSNARPTRHG